MRSFGSISQLRCKWFVQCQTNMTLVFFVQSNTQITVYTTSSLKHAATQCSSDLELTTTHLLTQKQPSSKIPSLTDIFSIPFNSSSFFSYYLTCIYVFLLFYVFAEYVTVLLHVCIIRLLFIDSLHYFTCHTGAIDD